MLILGLVRGMSIITIKNLRSMKFCLKQFVGAAALECSDAAKFAGKYFVVRILL